MVARATLSVPMQESQFVPKAVRLNLRLQKGGGKRQSEVLPWDGRFAAKCRSLPLLGPRATIDWFSNSARLE